MLDDDHGVAFVYQTLQHEQQLAYVFEMQSRGGLIENVYGLAGRSALQFRGKLHTLRFTSGESRCGLAQTYVPQSDLYERVKVP